MPTHGALARWPARTHTQPRPTKSHFFFSFARGPSRARAPRPPGSRARASRWQRARTKSSHERHPSRTAAIRASLSVPGPPMSPQHARSSARDQPKNEPGGRGKKKPKRPAPRARSAHFPSHPPPVRRARERGRGRHARASERARAPAAPRDAPASSLMAAACRAGRGGGASAARALWRPDGPFRCLPPSGFDRGEKEITCVLTCGSGRRIGRAARARARRPRAPP